MANFKSNISFALVNIPIIINPIIKNNDAAFNQLHDKCHHRIKYIKYCPYCKEDIKEKNVIKGFQYEKDNYLIFGKEELNKLKPNNDKEIEIVSFINIDEVKSYYFQKSYVLESEKKSKAYDLFCEALKKTKKVALAKTVIGNKFYYCILQFSNFGIIMTTLYFEEEVEIPDETDKINTTSKELNLAIKLIESLEGKFEPQKYKDEYQDKIKEAVDDKLESKNIKETKKSTQKKVNNLMKALEKSLKDKK